MSHIYLFVAKLSFLCRTISIQINTGGEIMGDGGIIYRVGICPRGEKTEENDVGARGGGGVGGESRLMYLDVPFNHFRKIKFDRLTNGLQHRY